MSHCECYLQRLRVDLEEREARLRAKDEEMKQRDAEITRLMEELERCQGLAMRLLTQVYKLANVSLS